MSIDLDDPTVLVILHLVGVPYVYGAGAPADFAIGVPDLLRGVVTKDSHGVRGLDCSGSVLGVGVTLGQLSPRHVDTTAHGIAYLCDDIDEAKARAGDLVFYDVDKDGTIEHAAVYLGGGMVVSMSGGSRHTFGTDRNACGKALPAHYQRVKCFGRWKASVAP